MSAWKKSLSMWWVPMTKIKKLTWFGAFCSLLQYTRERKIAAYLLANAFSCVAPAILLVLFGQGRINWAAAVGLSALFRVAFAPLDDYASDETAYSKLSGYPLNIFEMVYIRLVTKVTQVAEWLYFVALGWVYGSLFPLGQALVLTVLTVLTVELLEEVAFYLVYLVKNVKQYVVAFEVLCVGIGAMLVLRPVEMTFTVAAVFLGAVLAVGIALMVVLHRNRSKIHTLAGSGAGKRGRVPISSRIMLAASEGSALTRLVCMEWVCLLKMKVWDLISALGYMVVFSVMEQSETMVHVLVQYFIVDYCFLVGFNYFANIDDREGMFLYATVDRKTQIRSKNLSLLVILAVVSTVATLVLGAVHSLTFKTLMLTLVGNLFIMAVMLLCSSVLSVKHFHLSDSKKKYTVSNLVTMLVVLVLSSMITTFLMSGGALAAVALLFMIMATLACLYFTLVDLSMLEKLFIKNQDRMAQALRR